MRDPRFSVPARISPNRVRAQSWSYFPAIRGGAAGIRLNAYTSRTESPDVGDRAQEGGMRETGVKSPGEWEARSRGYRVKMS